MENRGKETQKEVKQMDKFGWRRIIFILFLWIAIFDPPLIPQFNIIHILGAISILYLIINKEIKSYFFKIEMIACILLLYIAIIYRLNGINNFFDMYLIYWVVDIIPISFVIVDICRKENIDYNQFEEMLIKAGFFAAILSLCSFVNEDIHQFFIDSFIKARYDSEYVIKWAFRTHGYASNLQFSSPITMAVISLLALKKVIFQGRIKYLLISLLLVSMSYVNARVSLVIFIGGAVLLFFINVKKTKGIIKSIILIVGAMAIVFSTLIVYIRSSSEYNEQLYWLYDGIANILSLFSSGVTKYYDTIEYFTSSSRYVLPNSISSFVFGTGETIMSSNSYGVYTDIGFINDIWYGGILYAIFMYFCFGYMVYDICRRLMRTGKKNAISVAVILAFAIIIANIKGIAISFNNLSTLIIMLYIYLLNLRCNINKKDYM